MMISKTTLSLFTSFFLLCFLLNSASSSGNGYVDLLKKSQFPDGFLFGVSTSSYQIEGATHEDGRGPSNWDQFVHGRGNIANGDVADDHYHRYKGDIEIIQSLGVDSYRFSISWSRILPKGKFGDVNQAGIAFYDSLINDLLLKGIKPFVTIHHHDYPQELQDRYGGWLSPMMQEDFVYFAEICFKSFGDRVKHWVTINEPNIFAEMAYMRGLYPPARCSSPFGNCAAGNSDREPLIAMHNMLLGHAKAVNLYRQQFQSKQGGIIGMVINAFNYEPISDDEFDKEAANRALAFNIAWVFEPLIFGHYPREMHRYLGSALPRFTSEERKLIKDSTDFLGINHYATLYAKDCLHSTCECSDSSCSSGSDRAIKGFVLATAFKNGSPIGDQTGMTRLFVVPRGMEEIVNYIKNRYNNKPIYITENGYSSPRQQNSNELQDDVKRIEFHKDYLESLAKAMKNGADVRGYFIWTLMDDFEWSNGYAARFGLYSVDQATMDRYPRSSANWFRDFLKNNGPVLDKNNFGLMRNVQEGTAQM